MRAKYAREIRRGIRLAQQVMRGERVGPSSHTELVYCGAARELWERAYAHIMRRNRARRIPPTHAGGEL